MPLRRAAPRNPRKASIVIGAPTMAKRTDSSTTIMKQTATSRRQPPRKPTQRSSPRVDPTDCSLLSKKEQKKIKKILRDDNLSSEAKQCRINKIYDGGSSRKRKHRYYSSSSSSSSNYSSDSD
jgi:hypothetical protein